MNKKVIIRAVVTLVILINQVLVLFGFEPLPYDENQVYEGATAVATVGGILWAWWKNNSFTKEAKHADNYLDSMKKKKKNDKKKAKNAKKGGNK